MPALFIVLALFNDTFSISYYELCPISKVPQAIEMKLLFMTTLAVTHFLHCNYHYFSPKCPRICVYLCYLVRV